MNSHSRVSESQQTQRLRVQAILWNSLGRGSVAYTVNELLDNLPKAKADPRLWCLSRDPDQPREYHRPVLPDLLYRLLCKAGIPPKIHVGLAREIALREVAIGDIVYLWPPYDLEMIRRAQERGAIVVAERINCMGTMVRNVLTPAFARRGLPLPEGWCTPKGIEQERREMMQCDFVTAPNAFVAQSLRDSGISQDRILETSYGYDPDRLASAIGTVRPSRDPVFAFVGLGIIRKGFDVLLEAWAAAEVRGKLLIAGHIEDDLRRDYAEILARPDVGVLGYVPDIASAYAAADVFVFPTHEEGGPQVTYEAAACGLPCIVSPMGTGRLVRDGVEGIVIDPLDVKSLAEAIGKLAGDEKLRRKLGKNAAERAQDFTWAKVGGRLYDLFHDVAQALSLSLPA